MYFSMPDHGGTHIDAPLHFDRRGQPINEYPLANCIVAGICLDLRHIAPRAEITPADLEAAVKQSGIRSRRAAPCCSARPSRTHLPRKEYATENSGVNVAATEWLANKTSCISASIRCGPARSKENLLVHKACFELGITHIESLCNLEALLGAGPFTFIGLPMKWRGGTASPIRAWRCSGCERHASKARHAGHRSLPCADYVHLSALPGIHVLASLKPRKTWMAGTSPAMTKR